EINRTVVVEVGHGHAGGVATDETSLRRHIRKGAVSVVAPHLVGKDGVAFRHRPGKVEVQIAVVIVIDEGRGEAFFWRLNAVGFRGVGKFAAALVVEEVNAVVHAYGEIGFAVVVVVAGSAAQSATAEFDP